MVIKLSLAKEETTYPPVSRVLFVILAPAHTDNATIELSPPFIYIFSISTKPAEFMPLSDFSSISPFLKVSFLSAINP